LISDIKEGTKTWGLREYDAEENIWTEEDNITGGWRKVRIKKLNIFYPSPNIIRMIESRWIKWTGHGPRMWEKKNALMILVGKPEGRRPLGRYRHR
jgi:hypothetical protein